MRKPIMLAAAAVSFWYGAAAAQECLDQVAKLAGEQGVSTELPQAQSDGQGLETQQPAAGQTTTPDDLAQSGGVVAPPDTDSDMPVIEPPVTGDAMPTAPKVVPQPESDSLLATEAAKKTQIQSLLTAARQAAESGDTQGCLDQLQKARALAAGAQQ
jgi:hypothetical protein